MRTLRRGHSRGSCDEGAEGGQLVERLANIGDGPLLEPLGMGGILRRLLGRLGRHRVDLADAYLRYRQPQKALGLHVTIGVLVAFGTAFAGRSNA